MAALTLDSVNPEEGPTSGGDLVRLAGTGVLEQAVITFGGLPAEVLSIREGDGGFIVDVRTSRHDEALVEITLRDAQGEESTLAGAYRFVRPRLVQESTLARLVRALIHELKRQLLANVSVTVSIDYDDTTVDGLNVIALATLPSIVLSGPRVAENRFLSSNELHEEVVAGPSGPELMRRRPAYTVDLAFTLTVASNRTVELLNLMSAVSVYLNRNRWIGLPRDPSAPDGEQIRWEMNPQGELRTRLNGPDDLRVFTCGFVVEGFNLDEGLPLDLGRAVAEATLDAIPLTNAKAE